MKRTNCNIAEESDHSNTHFPLSIQAEPVFRRQVMQHVNNLHKSHEMLRNQWGQEEQNRNAIASGVSRSSLGNRGGFLSFLQQEEERRQHHSSDSCGEDFLLVYNLNHEQSLHSQNSPFEPTAISTIYQNITSSRITLGQTPAPAHVQPNSLKQICSRPQCFLPSDAATMTHLSKSPFPPSMRASVATPISHHPHDSMLLPCLLRQATNMVAETYTHAASQNRRHQQVQTRRQADDDTTRATSAPPNQSQQSAHAIDQLQPKQLQQQVGTNKPHPPMLLYVPADDDVLSDYQILVRQHVEFFGAEAEDVETTTPGRKKAVALGQVGIRCKHCYTKIPIYRRSAATVYFPATLSRLYQSTQNIALTHFEKCCECIPEHVREKLKAHHAYGKKATAGHGGKVYWARAAIAAGVIETEQGLRFASDWYGDGECGKH